MTKKDRRVKYVSDTEKPVMVSVRLPRELYDRLECYASEHRQHISELVKDGVEMRLETEADPRSLRAGSPTDDTEFQIDGASILRDMQATLARHEAQMQTLMQAREQRLGETESEQAPSVPLVVMTPKVKVDKEEVLVRIQQMRDKGLDSTQIAETLQAEGVPTLSAEAQLQAVVEILEHRAAQDCSEGNTGTTSVDGDIPAASMEAQSTARQTLAAEDTRKSTPLYDPAKHHLASLCPRQHAWGTTGQSLRNADNQCLECKAQEKREKRAKKRQATAP
jgi:hypothetical protein